MPVIFYVYMRLYPMNILSLQSFCIKILQNFNSDKHLLLLKEQTESFCKVIHTKHGLVQITRKYLKSQQYSGRQTPKGSLA